MNGIEAGSGSDSGSQSEAGSPPEVGEGEPDADGERDDVDGGDGQLDRISVSMVVSDIDSVRRVLECLGDVDATVRPETLSVETPARSSISIDVRSVTPKQWEALELAFDRGYYARPREADLGEISDVLSISKSAVSQRLRAAEASLVASVLEAVRSGSAIEGESGGGR